MWIKISFMATIRYILVNKGQHMQMVEMNVLSC